MSKTNRRFHLLTIKLPLLVEGEPSLGEEAGREAALRMVQEAMPEECAVALLGEVTKTNAVAEGAGEIGTRFVSFTRSYMFLS
jgi:hypothetical protein